MGTTDMKANGQPTFALTLRAEPGNWQAPPVRRLARFLKAALRAYGLRCTDCREVQAPAHDPDRAGIDRELRYTQFPSRCQPQHGPDKNNLRRKIQ